VACGSATTCEAGGSSPTGTGFAVGTINGGGKWTAQTLPGGSSALSGLACISATRCEATASNPGALLLTYK
jgi:hypothetical protein